MRCWEVTGDEVCHTQSGDIDPSWDDPSVSVSWELEDRALSLSPKMDCPEMQLLGRALGRQLCEM